MTEFASPGNKVLLREPLELLGLQPVTGVHNCEAAAMRWRPWMRVCRIFIPRSSFNVQLGFPMQSELTIKQKIAAARCDDAICLERLLHAAH
ncbi:MAG TPA: hypothetical protein VIJ06_08480 [Methylovirgula sp.]